MVRHATNRRFTLGIFALGADRLVPATVADDLVLSVESVESGGDSRLPSILMMVDVLDDYAEAKQPSDAAWVDVGYDLPGCSDRRVAAGPHPSDALDVVVTGWPLGNGSNFGRFIRPGNVLEGSIDGLSVQRNRCVAESLALNEITHRSSSALADA